MIWHHIGVIKNVKASAAYIHTENIHHDTIGKAKTLSFDLGSSPRFKVFDVIGFHTDENSETVSNVDHLINLEPFLLDQLENQENWDDGETETAIDEGMYFTDTEQDLIARVIPSYFYKQLLLKVQNQIHALRNLDPYIDSFDLNATLEAYEVELKVVNRTKVGDDNTAWLRLQSTSFTEPYNTDKYLNDFLYYFDEIDKARGYTSHENLNAILKSDKKRWTRLLNKATRLTKGNKSKIRANYTTYKHKKARYNQLIDEIHSIKSEYQNNLLFNTDLTYFNEIYNQMIFSSIK